LRNSIISEKSSPSSKLESFKSVSSGSIISTKKITSKIVRHSICQMMGENHWYPNLDLSKSPAGYKLKCSPTPKMVSMSKTSMKTQSSMYIKPVSCEMLSEFPIAGYFNGSS